MTKLMMSTAFALIWLGSSGLAFAQDPPAAASGHPVELDRTGIQWVLPFAKAKARALETKRPLLIKAVAFGTTKNGCW